MQPPAHVSNLLLTPVSTNYSDEGREISTAPVNLVSSSSTCQPAIIPAATNCTAERTCQSESESEKTNKTMFTPVRRSSLS